LTAIIEGRNLMKSSLYRFLLIVVLTCGCLLNATADDLIHDFFGVQPELIGGVPVLLAGPQDIEFLGGFAQSVAGGLTENFPISSVVPPYAVRRIGEEIVPAGPPGMGPLLFSERATTQGRGIFNTSVSFTYLDYDEFEGDKLSDIPVSRRDIGGGFVRDISANLDIEANLAALALAYGVTDNLDIAVVVPWVTIDFETTRRALLIAHTISSKVWETFLSGASGSSKRRARWTLRSGSTTR
jgi:hypothetical protein